MSKKRTSAESNNDEQLTNEGSDSVLQQDNAKRAKLAPMSNTTLQNLSIQLLKRILVKAIAMEVKGMKLAKSVWEEKADLVISRLKNVSLRWSTILTTNEFLTEVHRILDDTAEETIRLEILHQSWINLEVISITTMKDEIFMLCAQGEQRHVNVHDRNNIAEVKDVILLPGTHPVDIEACNVSNCVYALCLSMDWKCPSIVRITKDEEHQFNILPWISDLKRSVSGTGDLSVSSNGILSLPHGHDPVAVSLYNANGSLMMSADIYGFKRVNRVIQKSNGNLVLASINGDSDERVLTEIDTAGKIQRQYTSSFGVNSNMDFADMYGRIVISKRFTGLELLDSELNLLDFVGLQWGQFLIPGSLHYNTERNEVMSVCAIAPDKSSLAIFRFTEE